MKEILYMSHCVFQTPDKKDINAYSLNGCDVKDMLKYI